VQDEAEGKRQFEIFLSCPAAPARQQRCGLMRPSTVAEAISAPQRLHVTLS
jgi:hypothetical protein